MQKFTIKLKAEVLINLLNIMMHLIKMKKMKKEPVEKIGTEHILKNTIGKVNGNF